MWSIRTGNCFRRLAAPTRFTPKSHIRFDSTKPQYQAPNPTPATPSPDSPPINPHRAFYKAWGIPLVKVFLGAMFTYQVLYYGWLKLESIEQKKEKDAEMKLLEGQLAELTASKSI
ncbi:hypothetical protein FKW77_004175 [Venturia effusa]|uniref:Inner membrane assembly complex subunit 17 n=1 Tax=Venturia effusa TaxID=50376 RepID=A0A517KW68_9PEZI|nr:hypothetical protein FKW77_004175 [Venturia effusa]